MVSERLGGDVKEEVLKYVEIIEKAELDRIKNYVYNQFPYAGLSVKRETERSKIIQSCKEIRFLIGDKQ
jgi:hypothetical protein